MTVGPAPLIVTPVAPASKAASRTSSYPSISFARAGVTTESYIPWPTISGSLRCMPEVSVAAFPTVSTSWETFAPSGTTSRASRVETTMSGRQATRGISASTVRTPESVAMVNPPRIAGATLSSWASPDTTASPFAAIGTRSARVFPRS